MTYVEWVRVSGSDPWSPGKKVGNRVGTVRDPVRRLVVLTDESRVEVVVG